MIRTKESKRVKWEGLDFTFGVLLGEYELPPLYEDDVVVTNHNPETPKLDSDGPN